MRDPSSAAIDPDEPLKADNCDPSVVATASTGVRFPAKENEQERTDSQEILEAIQPLFLSSNPRDRTIAERITALHRDAIAEDELISLRSLCQVREFLLAHPKPGIPKITLTPDGTLRLRWIYGPGSFVAVEFSGGPLAKLVAESPRENGLTARTFATETVSRIAAPAHAANPSFE